MAEPPTIAYLIADGFSVTVYCGWHLCPRNKRGSGISNGRPLDLSAYDPATRLDQIKARLRCEVCGKREGRTIVSPDDARGIGRPGLE